MASLDGRLTLAAYRRYCALRRSMGDRYALANFRRLNEVAEPVFGIRNIAASHGCVIGPGCRFEGRTTIGPHTTISPDCHFSGLISIGAYTQFGPKCVVLGSDHPTDTVTPYSNAKLFGGRLKRLHNDAPVHISDGALIGAASIILPGSVIGRGVIVGAGSVVRDACQPYSLYVGNPARLVRRRVPVGAADQIERTRWWERDPDDLLEIEDLFFERYGSECK